MLGPLESIWFHFQYALEETRKSLLLTLENKKWKARQETIDNLLKRLLVNWSLRVPHQLTMPCVRAALA